MALVRIRVMCECFSELHRNRLLPGSFLHSSYDSSNHFWTLKLLLFTIFSVGLRPTSKWQLLIWRAALCWSFMRQSLCISRAPVPASAPYLAFTFPMLSASGISDHVARSWWSCEIPLDKGCFFLALYLISSFGLKLCPPDHHPCCDSI